MYAISALTGAGTRQVVYDIMNYLDNRAERTEHRGHSAFEESSNDGQG